MPTATRAIRYAVVDRARHFVVSLAPAVAFAPMPERFTYNDSNAVNRRGRNGIPHRTSPGADGRAEGTWAHSDGHRAKRPRRTGVRHLFAAAQGTGHLS